MPREGERRSSLTANIGLIVWRNPQQLPRPAHQKSIKPTKIEDTEYWLEKFGIEDIDESPGPPDIPPNQPVPEIPDDEIQEPEKGDNDSFNPFPDGYGEELLDD